MPGIFMNKQSQRVTLLCQNGQVYTRLKAIINTKSDNYTILFEGKEGMASAGDRIEYKDPEGITITYVITDPGFHPKSLGVTPYYCARVKEEAQYYRTASDEVIPIPFAKAPGSENSSAGTAPKKHDVTDQTAYAGPIVSQPKSSDSDEKTALLFATLRTGVNGQPDRKALLFLLDQMEAAVGTPEYTALYNAFLQAVADRISLFAASIPDLSRLLLTTGSTGTDNKTGKS